MVDRPSKKTGNPNKLPSDLFHEGGISSNWVGQGLASGFLLAENGIVHLGFEHKRYQGRRVDDGLGQEGLLEKRV
jgi:hypothetical protein